MHVKKFEAPTMQEALDTIKRELGPEAIILQTKQNKSGFGILSKGSVEVTAAISDRAIQKKKRVDSRVPEPTREAVGKMSAGRQADIYERYNDRGSKKGRHAAELYADASPADHLSAALNATEAAQAQIRVTARRYSDIDKHEVPVPAQPAARPQASLSDESSAMMQGSANVQTEMKQIKRMLAELRAAQEEAQSNPLPGGRDSRLATPAMQEAFDELILHGMDRRLAFQMIKQAAFDIGSDERVADPVIVQDQLASMIMDTLKVAPFLDGIPKRASDEAGELQGQPRIIAFVGPTGVGKTTTVAKVASQALLQRSLKVGLINLDNYKVAAAEQLQAYGKALNVPFRNAGGAEDLAAAIRDFQKLDLILIDTAGRSQRDPAALAETRALIQSAGADVSTQLVLSVTTRDQELGEIAQRFAVFEPKGMIFSKLDEASAFGAIVNLSQKTKLPLSYFATGQRVPEDIEAATPERVVSLMMDI